MKKYSLHKYLVLCVPMPAVLLGAFAMVQYQLVPLLLLENVVCFIVAVLSAGFVASMKRDFGGAKCDSIIIAVSLLLLILTFLSPGMNGVQRWISLGILKLNVSMIVMPMVMITLWKIAQRKHWIIFFGGTISITAILLLQPDASQLTAFAVSMAMILWNKTPKKSLGALFIAIFSLSVILSWVFLDGLAPVPYVEGILGLLWEQGGVWLIAGVLSLVLLPMPFLLFPPKKSRLPSVGVGLYYGVLLISTLFGNFPVPLMGYGVSPIIGYFIAITWYIKAKNNENEPGT